ncbi:DUF2599 domain-containing protein [Streptomyces gilvosporeus]|uniref:DUF2599 domain-containing protein n=1 Tax=Streptomyces gilvosporeus TaxID=553510 RepID=A0A1V0U127_9ACTN|nr:DUF2599 domain-containing protein [Streptomyces gilvosporeus]ARF58876.1 hypothetical protein B1H19_36035 [Streptomyces gilvosporeus]
MKKRAGLPRGTSVALRGIVVALLAASVVGVQAPAASAQEVCGRQVGGDILEAYNRTGGEGGPLGCPTTNEETTPDGRGRYNHFVGGSIYWTPETGAHPVWGAIRDKWKEMGWETSKVGYPVGDELTNPDGEGKRQEFEHGTFYWHPTRSNGAHAVWGNIGWVWGAYHWESGAFGYPTSDVSWDGENREWVQKFGGSKFIFSNPDGNNVEGCVKQCAGYYGVDPAGPGSPGNLINQTRVEIPLTGDPGSWEDTFVVRAWPTTEGRLAGRALIPAEWDQMWSRVPKPWAMTDTKNSSLYKQFACHVMFVAPKPSGGWLGGYSWDLESWRDDISWLKAMDPLTNHKCNW